MNTHPVNLMVRFLLEILMLVILGYRGWHLGEGWLSYVLALAFPLCAAVLWGVFRIPNDPKPAPVAIPGVARLLLEFLLFGAAVWSLASLRYLHGSIALAVVVIIHYAVSWDRTLVMLQNKPYNGFAGKKIMGMKP
ncbi:YrdB family protein [Chitinophaga sp.]|uniref:YrdB family protein n=1 Tax=Chitinophaga sp. TaxID=1869181 RepID=UPI002C68AEBE|nr:YrdB family protein [Chitinophaga sp.]HWV69420.1 YrdB family protein [Chitinophaga sp.]